MKAKGIISQCVLVVAVVLITSRILDKQQKVPVETQIIITDTLYVRDTIIAYKPEYVHLTHIDTVLYPVTDTVRERDTLFLALSRDCVEWSDSLATVWASGVGVSVDSVRHYAMKEVVTNVVEVRKPQRWGIGVQAGYGASAIDGNVRLAPYVGVGISYNLFEW